jgi:hypothetical protein
MEKQADEKGNILLPFIPSVYTIEFAILSPNFTVCVAST